MFKIAVLVWIMLGTALAGSLVLVVVAVPSLAAEAARFIPYAAGAGFLAAVPLALLIGRAIFSRVAR